MGRDRYPKRMPHELPVNPFTASWRWAGYRGDQHGAILQILSALGIALGGVLSTYFLWIGILVMLAMAGLLVPGIFWRRRADRDDLEGDSRELLLEQSLRPLLELASETTSKPRRQRSETMKSAVDRVSRDIRGAFDDVEGVRVVVFQVSDDGLKMTPYAPAGRQDRPGPFERETPRGEKAFDVLGGKRAFVAVDDLSTTDPDEWQGSGDGYSTFISAPIRNSELGMGLLTMDAPKAGSLPARHGSTLALFAAALGVLMAEAARSGGGTS